MQQWLKVIKESCIVCSLCRSVSSTVMLTGTILLYLVTEKGLLIKEDGRERERERERAVSVHVKITEFFLCVAFWHVR
jgi:hypothetical protein